MGRRGRHYHPGARGRRDAARHPREYEAEPNGYGRIMEGMPALETIFGWRPGELLGQPVELLVTARFRSGHAGDVPAYFAAARNRPMGHGRQQWGRRQRGADFPVELSLIPLPI